MPIELTDKVCLITGADEGVGHGLVHGFLRRGARVGAGLLDLDASRRRVGSALPLQMDVTRPDQVRAAVAEVLRQWGRIDVLVNNAGIYPRTPADQLTFADWRRTLDVNLDGTWHCCEAVIPPMKEQGRGVILNVGSVALRRGMAEVPHYLASKGGVLGLTRALARDLGPDGIRVNCIHLGAVETEGEKRLYPDPEAARARVEPFQSLKGRLTPESVEPVFAFFASEESGDVSGQGINVDRGRIHD